MERNIDKPLSQQTKERGTYAHKVVAVELAEQFAKLFDQLSLHPCKTTQHDKYVNQPRFPSLPLPTTWKQTRKPPCRHRRTQAVGQVDLRAVHARHKDVAHCIGVQEALQRRVHEARIAQIVQSHHTYQWRNRVSRLLWARPVIVVPSTTGVPGSLDRMRTTCEPVPILPPWDTVMSVEGGYRYRREPGCTP